MTELKGIVVPIVTPMNEDESITSRGRQVDRQIEAGIHGIFPFGTNGEGYIPMARRRSSFSRRLSTRLPGAFPCKGKLLHLYQGDHRAVQDG